MKVITPSELIDAFLSGETNMRTWTQKTPGPLRIMNDKIISFETVICEKYGEFYIINPTLYSRQTEIAQKILLTRIPKERQLLTKDVPFTYWGSLVEYAQWLPKIGGR